VVAAGLTGEVMAAVRAASLYHLSVVPVAQVAVSALLCPTHIDAGEAAAKVGAAGFTHGKQNCEVLTLKLSPPSITPLVKLNVRLLITSLLNEKVEKPAGSVTVMYPPSSQQLPLPFGTAALSSTPATALVVLLYTMALPPSPTPQLPATTDGAPASPFQSRVVEVPFVAKFFTCSSPSQLLLMAQKPTLKLLTGIRTPASLKDIR
jgi:hypothetical protein